MSANHQRERRHSFGPTIYHDEEDMTVKKPPRVYYEEVTRDKPRRSSSVQSRGAATHHENATHHPETVQGNATPPRSLGKPGFVETFTEIPYGDDEKGYSEKPQYIEKPFSNDGSKIYANSGYIHRDYDQRGRRGTVPRYEPPQPQNPLHESDLWWTRVRIALHEPFAEFFGVFLLVLFGDGAIAQVVLSKNTRGDWQSICWGWGLGAMLGVYAAGISGANINPGVTLANCIFRKHPWHKLPIYAVAQILGAFTAAGVVYANYKLAIDAFEGGPGIRTVPGFSDTATAGIFATYPQEFMTKTSEFFSEFIASAILMFCIYMLQDNRNMGADKLIPLILFFVIFGIGACFGWETGFAINMARDLGPRLMTYFVGYGDQVWTSGGHYFWVPMIAPMFGCVFGGWLYDVFLYTGESPINTPWMGLKRLIRPTRVNDNPV
ncbi:hypothetical protein K3495_g4294 [Podosphaera aphanis]|nr:hypothetical protein K3495_g4294 [Podosphaera aphanis]